VSRPRQSAQASATIERGDGHRRRHVVIVGGGISGLAAAHALTAGPDPQIACTLVEEDRRLGGKIHTEHIQGCVVEHGAESFLASKPWAASLCRSLGLGDRLVGTRPGYPVHVAWRGRLHPLPEGVALGVPTRVGALARSSLFSPREKLRMALDVILPRGRAVDESVGALVRRRLGEAAVDRLAGPLLGGIYAGDPDQLSAQDTAGQLVAWEAQSRSLILAGLTHRQRRSAAPGTPPSPMFLSLSGGMGEMVDRLTAALHGTAVLTGRRVIRVRRLPEPSSRGYAAILDDGTQLEADGLVLATPAYAAARLLDPLAPAAARRLRAIPYVSTAAVTLAYRRQAVRHPLEGNGFVVARGEPLHITACTWVSSKWPGRAPEGLALLRCYLGAAGREAVLQETDQRLLDLVRADLRATLGVEAAPLFASLARWPMAMPQYTPGHLARVEAIERELQSLPGILLAGAGYRGIGVPDCIRQGSEAAHRLAEFLHAGQPGAWPSARVA
jgi:protoporphyrinogen/coproporphyrinogen III oxidase